MKTVFLVTHGEKADFDEIGRPTPDPGMTALGRDQVRQLRSHLNQLLPNGPTAIHVGTGRRQGEVVDALGFDYQTALVSPLWGDAASGIKVAGKMIVVLSDGRLVAWDHYCGTEHLSPMVATVIATQLPDGALICSGRPVVYRLGLPLTACESGAIYGLTVADDGSITIELLISGVKLYTEGAAV